MNYIIVTSAKNEEKSLPGLIESVASQSIKPALWVLVDDGSTDKTQEKIEEAIKKYRWIRSIRLETGKRDLNVHIARVIKIGYDFAIEYCKEHSIECDYISFLDADMILKDKDFFKKFISRFEKDKKLAIASGLIESMDTSGTLHEAKNQGDTISCGGMVCRREFLEQIGGFPLSAGQDSVLRAKAIMNGWKIQRFNEIKQIQIRMSSSAEGIKKGYYIRGTIDYYLNYNPAIVVGKAMGYCLKKPHYAGMTYLVGYFGGLMQGKEQINDRAVRRFFYWEKPREILERYSNIFGQRRGCQK